MGDSDIAILSYSLPVSLIRQHCFCPRIPFFNEVLNVNPGDRPWQEQGIDYHEKQQVLGKRRNLCRFGFDRFKFHTNVALHSTKIACHGTCDAIIETDTQIAPIEFKLTAKTVSRGQRLQLAAYGMLAEEKFQKECKKMLIFFGTKGKVHILPLDDATRNEVTKVVASILNNVSSPLLPDSSAFSAQCGQCEYFNFCGDRETDFE